MTSQRATEIEQQIAAVFRQEGWRTDAGPNGSDLLLRKGKVAYIVEIKIASEARSDRLLPLLAQAILEARSYAKQARLKGAPMAVIAAPRLTSKVIKQLHGFVSAHAPDVAVRVIDLENARRVSGLQPGALAATKVNLFSDRHQWLLKVLLAPYLERPDLLNAPLTNYRNASELAKAGGVSVMTSFRFLRELKAEGFLDDASGVIRVVRLEELLRRWQAAAGRQAVEIPLRSLFPINRRDLLRRVLNALPGRACAGLFAAADLLHLGFVKGAPIHIYVSHLPTLPLSKMKLVSIEAGRPADVFLRVVRRTESIFRGAVEVDGLRVCDVLQIWLDVVNYPARGAEQADLIFRRVIKSMIAKAQAVHA